MTIIGVYICHWKINFMTGMEMNCSTILMLHFINIRMNQDILLLCGDLNTRICNVNVVKEDVSVLGSHPDSHIIT